MYLNVTFGQDAVDLLLTTTAQTPLPPPLSKQDSLVCEGAPCVANCVLSEWSTWSSCSQSCAPGGERVRTRGIVTPAKVCVCLGVSVRPTNLPSDQPYDLRVYGMGDFLPLV